MQQIQIPPLSEGEVYGGGIVDRLGEVTHLILLAGDNNGLSQPEQAAWAKSIGGDLPSLAEQAVLREHVPHEFKDAIYWSNRNDGDGFAWYTTFFGGFQGYYHQSYKLRGRAVRRVKN